jgi:integrase
VRWKYEAAEKATKPGIWKLKAGGYLVRTKHGMRALPGASLVEAIQVRRTLEAPPPEISTPFFGPFAVSLYEERVAMGIIESRASRERWASALNLYLIPEFGRVRLDQVDVHALVGTMATWVRHGKPSYKDPKKTVTFAPTTANGILRILRTILNVAVVRKKITDNPFAGVSFFPEGRIYTVEEPNSLPPDTVGKFLALAQKLYPQHYAMMLLGFITGLRPSSLRPLRRNEDVLWKDKKLLIRQSHSRGQEVMGKTKTGYDQVISLPESVIAVLKHHVDDLPPGKMSESPLLFPSNTGKLRTRTVLDKPFKAIAKELELAYELTPRAMRRSFQDLARAAAIDPLITRSISGHRTEEMQDHYSTVREAEQRAVLDKITKMVKT